MKINKIPDDAVKISGSNTDYVDRSGNVYSYNTKNNQPRYPFVKEQSTVFGYKYCKIKYKEKTVSKRVHRLVADAFIPNPNNFPIVMHIDNNKSNNRVENLKWGTISENTKEAFDDGLTVNAKGCNDSQSIPCDCYETVTNRLIKSYGSRSEASEDTGISLSTISRQCDEDNPIRKKIYFTNHGCGPKSHDIIIQYDYDTDEEISRFPNCGKASKETGIDEHTIGYQINCNRKPKNKFSETYFLKVLLKCEETIESDK